MDDWRWTNPSHPQPLQNAVLLLYLSAAFDLLFSFGLGPILALLIAARVAAGGGIASERRWGYQLGVVAAFAPAVLRFLVGGLSLVLGINLISLAFEVLQIALLLHPDSREYQRVWFR